MIISGYPVYSFRTDLPARKFRTFATTTGACPLAFAACFCSFQSIMSPTAKIAGWDGSCRVFSTLTSLVSVSTFNPRDSSMKPVLGFGPEATICHYSVGYFQKAERCRLTTRSALSFFPDSKTSSPEPTVGNSVTDSPNIVSIFRAAIPALIRFLNRSGYVSFKSWFCACTIVIFLS